MEKKVNFLWLYSIVLFSAALILILISALSQMKFSPRETSQQTEVERLQAWNQTAQQNIASLIDENKQYKEELAKLNGEYDPTAAQALNDAKNELLRNDALFRARKYYTDNKFAECKDELMTMKNAELSAAAQEEFNELARLLTKKGFNLD